MATMNELSEKLLRRFRGVPNFTEEDALELIEESFDFHGYNHAANIPSNAESLVLLYAQSNGAWQIALGVAHYFKYTDGEESVDKSMVADNYRKLAREMQSAYDREQGKNVGSNFRIMTRLDRPLTLPLTGQGGRRRWQRF